MLGWVDSFSLIVVIHLFSFDPILFGCYLCRGKYTTWYPVARWKGAEGIPADYCSTREGLHFFSWKYVGIRKNMSLWCKASCDEFLCFWFLKIKTLFPGIAVGMCGHSLTGWVFRQWIKWAGHMNSSGADSLKHVGAASSRESCSTHPAWQLALQRWKKVKLKCCCALTIPACWMTA